MDYDSLRLEFKVIIKGNNDDENFDNQTTAFATITENMIR
jgi:hypothetical protein